MSIVLPTAYLPPVSYIAACRSAEEILIEAWETCPRQTLRNRCEILGPNGKQILSIPVSRPDGNRTKTRDIRIAYHLSWQKAHWRSLETAYNKSPFFLYYQDAFRPFYEKQYLFLLDLNLKLLEILCEALRLSPKVSLTERFLKEVPDVTDLRHYSGIKFPPRPYPEYYQVFAERYGFQRDLSVVDLLFNMGPEASDLLSSL